MHKKAASYKMVRLYTKNLDSLEASYTLKEVTIKQVWHQVKNWKWEFSSK